MVLSVKCQDKDQASNFETAHGHQNDKEKEEN